MNFTGADITAWINAYLWPFFRIGALVGAAPIFGTGLVPMRIRLGLALTLTLVIAPVIPAMPLIDPLSATGILISVQQVLIGLVMGFALQLVFAVFVFSGELIAMSLGLGFASMNDPVSGVMVPTVSQFYTLMVTLLFLAIDGHLVLIDVLARSFTTLPVAGAGLSVHSLWELVQWGGHLFSDAVLIALPAMTALLVVNLSFGVLTRAAPQLNMFAVGFPAILMIGLVVMWLTLPTVLPALTRLVDEVVGMLGGLLTAAEVTDGGA